MVVIALDQAFATILANKTFFKETGVTQTEVASLTSPTVAGSNPFTMPLPARNP